MFAVESCSFSVFQLSSPATCFTAPKIVPSFATLTLSQTLFLRQIRSDRCGAKWNLCRACRVLRTPVGTPVDCGALRPSKYTIVDDENTKRKVRSAIQRKAA
jgi:hypothetical protein